MRDRLYPLRRMAFTGIGSDLWKPSGAEGISRGTLSADTGLPTGGDIFTVDGSARAWMDEGGAGAADGGSGSVPGWGVHLRAGRGRLWAAQPGMPEADPHGGAWKAGRGSRPGRLSNLDGGWRGSRLSSMNCCAAGHSPAKCKGQIDTARLIRYSMNILGEV